MEDLLKQIRAITAWPEEVLQEHLAKWQAERNQLLAELEGERIWVDGSDLVIEAFPSARERARIQLGEAPKAPRLSPRAIALLNPGDGRQLGSLTLTPDSRPGLIVTHDRVLVHARCLERGEHLPLSESYVDAAAQDLRTFHTDLHMHLETGLLLVGLREAGEILVISLADAAELTRWQLRPPGSVEAFNIAFDVDGERAYFSDNLSAQLWIADLHSLEIKVWKSGLGVHGALAPGLEPGKIFLTVLTPTLSMLYFDTASMSASYSIELRGKSWVSAKLLAYDPFQRSPDGKLLQYLTWSELEGKRTAVVNLIDPQEVIARRRYALKELDACMMLAFPAPNPFKAWHLLDFKTWLIRNKLVQASQFVKPAEAPPPAAKKPSAPRRQFHIYQPPAEDQDLWNRIDAEGEKIELPIAAEEAIVDLLNWAFYRMTLTNLRVHAEELKRLQTLARSLRSELGAKQVVLAKLDNVLGKHAFETPISRKAVLELLHAGKLRGDSVRLEDLCPICQTPFENGLCPHCGFSLAWPEGEGHPPGSVSAEPATALYPGQLLLPAKAQNALLTLNIWRQPLQRLSGAEAGVLELSHAVALPNLNYLVADSKGNKVLELSPGGETLWKAKLALKRPVMVSWCGSSEDPHYLIVDQGNARVLELDRAGKHWRRYPTLKTLDEGKLKTPVDVQQTAAGSWLISDPGIQAVLEVDSRGQVLARWGAEQGVTRPLLARRQPDGVTEILDAGGKWLEFLPDGSAGRSFNFWPVPESRHQGEPEWACQLHNGEYLVLGPNWMLLIGPRHEAVRWIAPLPDPQVENALLKVGFRSRSAEDSRKAMLAQHAESLKEIGALEGEKEEHLQYLAKHVQAMSLSEGQWLLRPGESGLAVYFVLEGGLEYIAPEDEMPVIAPIVAGDICGLQAVTAGEGKESYRAGMRAARDSKLLLLERSEFKKAVVGFPRLYNIFRNLDMDLQRRFKIFAERKTEKAQDHLRKSINETRIRDFGLFVGADDAFFESLAEVVRPSAYMPEQDIFGRLESGGSLYLILEGQVGVLRKGEREPMIVLGEGEIIGEMALYLEQPRSATVRTMDYCKFFELEYRHVRALGKQYPWFGERLEDMARMRQRANELAETSFLQEAGLDRPDLPRLEVQPAGLRMGQLIHFMPSLHHDAVAGVNSLGELLWFWGREPERQLFHPGRVQREGDVLLVSDTGGDRVLEIEIATRELRRKWSVGLSGPRSAALTPEGLLLAADEGNQRLVAMDDTGRVVWTHGVPEEIMKPTWVEFTPEGNILFADAGMHRVYELQRDGVVVWKHGKWRNPGSGPDQLNEPGCVRRLEDGSTLIADTGNMRLVWVRPGQDTLMIPLEAYNFPPETCELMPNGELLVSSAEADRMIRVNRRGELTWSLNLTYPALAMPIAAPAAQAGDRWILDLDRIDELGPSEAAPEADLDAALAEFDSPEGADLGDLADVLGLDAPEPDLEAQLDAVDRPAQAVSWEDAQGDYSLVPELDTALDDALAELDAEPAPPAPPAAIADPKAWMDMSFLDDEHDSSQTLRLPGIGVVPDAPPAPEQLDDALAALFDDPAPEDIGDALDLLFDDPPSAKLPPSAPEAPAKPDSPHATQFVNPEPAMPTRVLPLQMEARPAPSMPTIPVNRLPWADLGFEEPPPPPKESTTRINRQDEISAGLDMFFDNLEESRQVTPFAPVADQPSGPPAQGTHFNLVVDSHPTLMQGPEQFPTQMMPAQGPPTIMVPAQPMPTVVVVTSPWAELGLEDDEGLAQPETMPEAAPEPESAPPSPQPSSGWSDDDFAWLDQMDD